MKTEKPEVAVISVKSDRGGNLVLVYVHYTDEVKCYCTYNGETIAFFENELWKPRKANDKEFYQPSLSEMIRLDNARVICKDNIFR